MSNAIARKERIVLGRDRLLRLLLLMTIVLVVASVLSGLQRESVFDKEKAAALETDRAVWLNQGERNPHSAAHFSRYAFRPASPLALLDPGTSDFSGLAVWMEAHFQDPAAFRQAEDGGGLSRYVQLTPAFIALTVAPLLVFLMLFGSVAGEREDRTLRQLLASGVDEGQFFRGKLWAGMRPTLCGLAVIFLLMALVSVLASPTALSLDVVVRMVSLFLVFSTYLAVFVALAIGISAMFHTRQSAFLALTFLWAVMVIVTPKLAGDLATTLHPQPDAHASTLELRAASDVYYRDTERREQIEKEVLERYNVEKVEDLPIDYGAYVLQVSEELSNPLFDEFYAKLDRQYVDQESIVYSFSLLTPAIAANSLSRGVAGTDRQHQSEFVAAAESHRRAMVKMLNDDYMYNADGAGYSYTAGADLWAKFEDFDYQIPPLSQVGRTYMREVFALAIWLIAALGFAFVSVRRAVVGEGAQS